MDRDKKEMREQWKMRERAQARDRFPLPDEELEQLFMHVERRLDADGCDDSRRFTEEWLAAGGHAKEAVLAWLDEHGGYCDCEVVANAADHFDDNRLGAHRGDTPDR